MKWSCFPVIHIFSFFICIVQLKAEDSDVCDHESFNKPNSRPTVGIVGCGPGGIAFLHAVNQRKRKMEEEGDLDGLSKLPIVTCIERESEPGGVWKSKRKQRLSIFEKNNTDDDDSGTNMYEALWTNGPKELFEFFDYTFQDYFNQSLPVFLPRKFVLDYILERVQHNNPNFFSSAKFNTEVQNVQYNEATTKFEVDIRYLPSDVQSTMHFDKFIWAAGENGIKSVPSSIDNILDEGGFLGKVMHSSTAGDFLSEVKGTNILMIGDAYSAEDLTLQSIKLGVKKVYILSRSGSGICYLVSSWPNGKAEVIADFVITEVINGGHGLRLAEATYNLKTKRTDLYPDGNIMDLEDISAIIYCTGYDMNVKMLSGALQWPFREYDGYHFNSEYESFMAKKWAMSSATFIGHVDPFHSIESSEVMIFAGIYRGILIDNPNMMYMTAGGITPLMELDIRAWFFLAHIMGDFQIPSKDEMNLRNTELLAELMQIHNWRYILDPNYQAEYWKFVEDDTYKNELDYLDSNDEYFTSITKVLAQEAQDALYPLQFGTGKELNAKGDLVVKMQNIATNARFITDPKSKNSLWWTFRDVDPSGFISLHTNTSAIAYEKKWIQTGDSLFDRF